MVHVEWSTEALDDLEELRGYIEARNPQAAFGLFVAIVEHVAQLPKHPNLGRPGRVPGTRELVVPRTRYVIAYTVIVSRTIRILGVRHGARNWPDAFGG